MHTLPSLFAINLCDTESLHPGTQDNNKKSFFSSWPITTLASKKSFLFLSLKKHTCTATKPCDGVVSQHSYYPKKTNNTT